MRISNRSALSRRSFLAVGASAFAAWSCGSTTEPRVLAVDELGSRPKASRTTLAPGRYDLGIGVSRFPGILPARDGILYLPASHPTSAPIPLLVLLHGAGGEAASWFGSYLQRAEAHQFAMLAIDSREDTWDLLDGGVYGPDVRFIDQALAWTFDRVRVDANRCALVGFSDGASYALSLGLSNGTLFSRIVAFSGCTVAVDNVRGKPEIFAAHGIDDDVLPIASCARVYVPLLRENGYAVEYQEFAGYHELPDAVSTAGMNWLDTSWSASPSASP